MRRVHLYLFVLVALLVGSSSFAGGFEPADRLVGRWVSLRSVNYPENRVRHQNGLGEISPIVSDLDRKDSSFHVVPGLAGPGTISFESFNYPGMFLRHQGGRIKLHPADGSDLFRKDASFVAQPGATGEGTTFRPSNYPEHALRHCSGHLFIDKNDGTNPACDRNETVYRSDISFVVERAPFALDKAPAPERVSLQALKFPDHYVRHCSGLGFIDNNHRCNGDCNPATFREDTTFSVVPGLAGGTSISLESVNYPGQFLRHQNGRIKLAADDGSPLFKLDASFERVPGLAGRESSLRSVNYPDAYIRHCSAKLFIDRNNGSNKDCDPNDDVFRSDVTFRFAPAN
jgi:hypothetical protein